MGWLIFVFVLLIGSAVHTYTTLEDEREDCEDRGGEFSWEITLELPGFIQGKSYCEFPEDSDTPTETLFWEWGTRPPLDEEHTPPVDK